jgi:hypothetical protein
MQPLQEGFAQALTGLQDAQPPTQPAQVKELPSGDLMAAHFAQPAQEIPQAGLQEAHPAAHPLQATDPPTKKARLLQAAQPRHAILPHALGAQEPQPATQPLQDADRE